MAHNHTKCPVLARCDQLWPHLTQHNQFWSIFDKCAWKGYVWRMTPDSGIYFIIWHLLVSYDLLQWCPAMVKNINFERVSPLQVRIEGPRSSISGYVMKALWDMTGPIWSNVAYSGPVFVIVSGYDRIGHICLCISIFEQFWVFPSCLIISR